MLAYWFSVFDNRQDQAGCGGICYVELLSWNFSCVLYVLIQGLMFFFSIRSICQDSNTGCWLQLVFLEPVLIFVIWFNMLVSEEQWFLLHKLSSEYRRGDIFILLQFSFTVRFGRETRCRWEGGVQEQETVTKGSRVGMYLHMCLVCMFCVMVFFPHF